MVLGLSVGYVVFEGVFPTVSFPSLGTASFLLAIAVLGLVAPAVRFATEALPLGGIALILSLPLGALFASLVALSPILFSGLYLAQPSDIPFFIAHYGLIFFALAFVMNLAGILVGMGIRGWYFRRLWKDLPFGATSLK